MVSQLSIVYTNDGMVKDLMITMMAAMLADRLRVKLEEIIRRKNRKEEENKGSADQNQIMKLY